MGSEHQELLDNIKCIGVDDVLHNEQLKSCLQTATSHLQSILQQATAATAGRKISKSPLTGRDSSLRPLQGLSSTEELQHLPHSAGTNTEQRDETSSKPTQEPKSGEDATQKPLKKKQPPDAKSLILGDRCFARRFGSLLAEPPVVKAGRRAGRADNPLQALLVRVELLCSAVWLYKGYDQFHKAQPKMRGRGKQSHKERYAQEFRTIYDGSFSRILTIGERLDNLQGIALLFANKTRELSHINKEGFLQIQRSFEKDANKDYLDGVWKSCYATFSKNKDEENLIREHRTPVLKFLKCHLEDGSAAQEECHVGDESGALKTSSKRQASGNHDAWNQSTAPRKQIRLVARSSTGERGLKSDQILANYSEKSQLEIPLLTQEPGAVARRPEESRSHSPQPPPTQGSYAQTDPLQSETLASTSANPLNDRNDIHNLYQDALEASSTPQQLHLF